MKDGSLDFSFSGLKSAVRRTAQEHRLAHPESVGGSVSRATRDLAASFQHAVVRVLVSRTLEACARESVTSILLTGGVAANGALRNALTAAAGREGRSVYVPSLCYTTDNAAMIAAAGFLHLERGDLASLDVDADAGLKL